MKQKEVLSASKKWLTRQEVAERFGVSIRTVDYWIKRRILHHVRIGRIIRVHAEAAETDILKFEVRSI